MLNSETVVTGFRFTWTMMSPCWSPAAAAAESGIDVGNDDALRPFGSLQLLAKIRSQALDRHALQSALLAAARQIAFAVALVLGFEVELAESHREIQSLAVAIHLQMDGGTGREAGYLQTGTSSHRSPGVPLMAVITSPTLRPALAAGLSPTTLAIATPCVFGTPKALAISGVSSCGRMPM